MWRRCILANCIWLNQLLSDCTQAAFKWQNYLDSSHKFGQRSPTWSFLMPSWWGDLDWVPGPHIHKLIEMTLIHASLIPLKTYKQFLHLHANVVLIFYPVLKRDSWLLVIKYSIILMNINMTINMLYYQIWVSAFYFVHCSQKLSPILIWFFTLS